MCMVSYIGDSFKKDWDDIFYPQFPYWPDTSKSDKAKIEALRKEVKALKKLLLTAQKYDKETGQPDCEVDEKVKLLKDIAKVLKIDMGKVFKEK